ncbi:hypothetical protein [Kitasatospora purpeofusca]|uniref:hypothetical protein n=1 Tax=Kitasatospora purpeofusca TaxID=67352 RepID=UPI00365F9CBE
MGKIRDAHVQLGLDVYDLRATPDVMWASRDTVETWPVGRTILTAVIGASAALVATPLARSFGDAAATLGLGLLALAAHAFASDMASVMDAPPTSVRALLVFNAFNLVVMFGLGWWLVARRLPAYPNALTLRANSAVVVCAKARSETAVTRAPLLLELDRACRNVELALLEAHRTSRSIRRRSPRRNAVKEHCALVAGALRTQLAQVDVEPDTGLVDLARMLSAIGENHAAGRMAALLPKAELEDTSPVSTRRASAAETVRLALAIAAATASTVTASLLLPSTGLPSAVHSPIVFGCAVVSGMLVAGRSRFARITEFLPGK